ncbi:urease subunit alpha [Bifidobacterium longum subsp. infantis]|nr:urease subunit alpha [Bifidobacterium longum subsp. infantis]
MIIKGGSILHARMGDANASIPTPEPVLYRDMFGAMGKALGSSCATFVSQAAHDDDIAGRLGLEGRCFPVRHLPWHRKKDLKFNDTSRIFRSTPRRSK